jgi:hypothetical protein
MTNIEETRCQQLLQRLKQFAVRLVGSNHYTTGRGGIVAKKLCCKIVEIQLVLIIEEETLDSAVP